MKKIALFLFTMLLGSVAFGQGIKLSLPGEGPYQIWFDSQQPGAPTADAQTVSGNSADLPGASNAFLAVLDSKSGNLAVLPKSALKGAVKLKATDFKYVGEVRIAVSHNGKAVQSCGIELASGGDVKTLIVDPSVKGMVSFYGVKAGQAKVTIHYNSNGKSAEPLIQLFKLDLQRLDAVPTKEIAITSDVATLDEAPSIGGTSAGGKTDSAKDTGSKDSGAKDSGGTADDGKSAVPKPMSPLSILGRVVGMLIGLGVIAGLIWALWYFLIKNPKAASERLTALGVQIPKDPDAQIDTPVPAVPSAAPQPVQKIMLDDAAPTPIGIAPAVPVAPVVGSLSFSDRPRLVKSDGEEFVVQEGATQVGREAGLGMSLVDEQTLSRKHAEVTRFGASISVKDLGSTNGTFVNGRKISSETPLNPGDTVQFGSVQFRVEA